MSQMNQLSTSISSSPSAFLGQDHRLSIRRQNASLPAERSWICKCVVTPSAEKTGMGYLFLSTIVCLSRVDCIEIYACAWHMYLISEVYHVLKPRQVSESEKTPGHRFNRGWTWIEPLQWYIVYTYIQLSNVPRFTYHSDSISYGCFFSYVYTTINHTTNFGQFHCCSFQNMKSEKNVQNF